jgi:hypothetical protein
VDVGDYFEGDVAQDSTGFTSGAAATGGTGGNQLQTLLSAQGTEVCPESLETLSSEPRTFTVSSTGV